MLVELIVATFDKRVFGLRPMWASNVEFFATLCGVILNVLIISATSDASLYGVIVLSIFVTAPLRFKFVSSSLLPLLFYDHLPAQTIVLICLYCKTVEVS